jgi:hypothetical protein
MRHRVTAAVLALASLAVFAPLALAAPPPQGDAAQKRTIDDIRNVGTAMYSWYQDQMRSRPKRPGVTVQNGNSVSFAAVPEISQGDLAKLLVPRYIQEVPVNDGWGHPYEYRLQTHDLDAEHIMALRSAGGDGRFSGDSYEIGSFPKGHDDEDVAWMDGYFVRWPEAKE